jgi:hypothetical protein
MPHEDMNGGTTGESYATKEQRMVAEKPKRVVMSIKPTTEAGARRLLGACNEYGDQQMVEKFAAEVRRLKD